VSKNDNFHCASTKGLRKKSRSGTPEEESLEATSENRHRGYRRDMYSNTCAHNRVKLFRCIATQKTARNDKNSSERKKCDWQPHRRHGDPLWNYNATEQRRRSVINLGGPGRLSLLLILFSSITSCGLLRGSGQSPLTSCQTFWCNLCSQTAAL